MTSMSMSARLHPSQEVHTRVKERRMYVMDEELRLFYDRPTFFDIVRNYHE